MITISKKALLIALCVIFAIIPIVVYTAAIVKTIQMDANCISYFELAADANSVEIAEKHLTTGIEYLEANDMTSGTTKIFVNNPKYDIGLWYENLKSAQAQLQELKTRDDLTDLEESNALMKLRETLLDESEVTHPLMISFYPNHISWFWTNILIWLLWIAALVFGVLASEEK